MSNHQDIKLFVPNAGLILVWPFLTRFFEQVSLLENEKFIDDTAKNRAVYLLQYLAYSSIDFPEHDLALNKLLVGLPIQHPLTPITELTPHEIATCNSLLEDGLIQHWDKVRNTAIEGIQETFLQREGLLKLHSDQNTLSIDNKGVDVLVDFIPWNISSIKLPWIENLLQVEWR